MEANYVHKDSTTLVQDELVKNELNQIELQYNALKQQKFNELLKENQELKLELSGYRQAILNNEEMLGLKEQNDKLKKKYENAVADYETTMFEKEQLNSLVNSCQEEIRQLKKQLENKYKKVGTLTSELLYEENTKLINQQKEFIKYLEDNIDKLREIISDNQIENNRNHLNYLIYKRNLYTEILQKYKSIIGVSDEKK